MPWAQSPAMHKLGMVAYTCDFSTLEVEAGGSEGLDLPWLYSVSLTTARAIRDLVSKKGVGTNNACTEKDSFLAWMTRHAHL